MNEDFSWLREDMGELRKGQVELAKAVSGMDAKLDVHTKLLDDHDKEIKTLTAGHNELRGMAKGIKWIWGILLGVLSLFGIHVASGGK